MSESKETTWTQHMSVIDAADEIDEFELDFTVRSGPQVITFLLGDEKYGVDILRARELITYPVGAVTPVPGMPAFIVIPFWIVVRETSNLSRPSSRKRRNPRFR